MVSVAGLIIGERIPGDIEYNDQDSTNLVVVTRNFNSDFTNYLGKPDMKPTRMYEIKLFIFAKLELLHTQFTSSF